MSQTTSCPHSTELDEVMSNLDHSIDSTIAERLKVEDAFARYAGWNFNGIVWWDRKECVWRCEIWCYHVIEGVVEAADLQTIQDLVCERWGNE